MNRNYSLTTPEPDQTRFYSTACCAFYNTYTLEIDIFAYNFTGEFFFIVKVVI